MRGFVAWKFQIVTGHQINIEPPRRAVQSNKVYLPPMNLALSSSIALRQIDAIRKKYGGDMAISLSRADLIHWAGESVAFFGLNLSRLSTVLLAQSYSSEINSVFDTFDLTHPIKVLEGLTSSDGAGPAQQFNHPPLTGLYKKHFTSPRFLVRNLLNFLRSKEGGRHFNSVWNEAAKVSGAEYIDKTFTKYLTHHLVVDPIAIKSASNRMTGEWVVFHKYHGVNYYLTIAFHGETNDQIHRRVALACEFDNLPFRL